jgi:hypothetical protein
LTLRTTFVMPRTAAAKIGQLIEMSKFRARSVTLLLGHARFPSADVYVHLVAAVGQPAVTMEPRLIPMPVGLARFELATPLSAAGDSQSGLSSGEHV